MRQICSFQKLKCHEKDSECEITHVWHIRFLEVVTGWRISSSMCSEKLNNLLEILLYDHGYRGTAKNVYWVVFLVGNLPPGWKLGDGFFFLISSLYSCNIISRMIFHWCVQYLNTGWCRKRTDHSPLLICCFVLACGFAIMWLMFAEGIGTKETQLPSIFGPSKSRMGWLWGWSYSASDTSEQRGMDEIIAYSYK